MAPVMRLSKISSHLLLAPQPTAAVTNRRIVSKSIPPGEPKNEHFDIISEPLPPIGDGQMLLKTKYLSVDPYMRTGEGLASEKSLGKTMVGGTVSEVVESKANGFKVGDMVLGYYGWQEHVVANTTDFQWGNKDIPIEKWDSSLGDPSTAIGVLGMTGYTAYFGLLEVGKPKAGETVCVSAASGAVGQVVGQLAKIQGCRVVGVAGGPKKCNYCTQELGFDACIDYKAAGFPDALKAACPKGIDVYFENVGGDVLEAVLPLLNKGCRVPVCGFVSQYNNPGMKSDKHPKPPPQRLQEFGIPRLPRDGSTPPEGGFRFFFWSEPAFMPRIGVGKEALNTLSSYIKQGKLKYKEDFTDGLDKTVDTFAGVLRGDNFGKAVIRIS